MTSPKIFIYTALACEAKPLVEHFGLKKLLTVLPFAVFVNQELCLMVTGLGKSAMAAGVAYSQALFAGIEHPVLVNIGIAGHKQHQLGELFLIDKITDVDSSKNYYPSLVYTPPCPTASLKTASKPQLNYDQEQLCDMEASAFYETALRFSTSELICCLKVISDNASTPAENIQAQQVSQLIAMHTATIAGLLTDLGQMAKLITLPEPWHYQLLISRYHFSISEQAQLKNQLCRWASLTDNQTLEFDNADLKKSKDVLAYLERQISNYDFYL